MISFIFSSYAFDVDKQEKDFKTLHGALCLLWLLLNPIFASWLINIRLIMIPDQTKNKSDQHVLALDYEWIRET